MDGGVDKTIPQGDLSPEDFDYHLPDSLIAQEPSGQRGGSRLLSLRRSTGEIRHGVFADFPGMLRDGDLLVVNDTRVFKARLLARRASGGRVQILLLRYPGPEAEVPCLVNPSRRLRDGEELVLQEGSVLRLSRDGGGFRVSAPGADLAAIADRIGKVPLPPYIRRGEGAGDELDRVRYQTVYARHVGAVAAPTAGLHFDDDALEKVREAGADLACVTLHVGPGTFLPVRERRISLHRMEKERYLVPPETSQVLRRTRERGGRVVAVGTTVVRTLESAWDGDTVRPGEGETGLFIYPGYRFSVVDALLTNFHLPKSTLLMLVCAFAGRGEVQAAYRQAVDGKYRFYSYGDAMFIE